MKHTKKKLFSVLLMLVMLVTLSIPVMAADSCICGDGANNDMYTEGCTVHAAQIKAAPAKVGSVYYPSLGLAIANAGSKEVVLNNEIELTSDLTISPAVTLNLNGHNITHKNTVYTALSLNNNLTVTGKGSIELEYIELNGKTITAKNGAELYFHRGLGTIKLESGTKWAPSTEDVCWFEGPMTITTDDSSGWRITYVSTGGKEINSYDDGSGTSYEGYFTHISSNELSTSVPAGKTYIVKEWDETGNIYYNKTITGPYIGNEDPFTQTLAAGGSIVETWSYGKTKSITGPYEETPDGFTVGGTYIETDEYGWKTSYTGTFSTAEGYPAPTDGSSIVRELKLAAGESSGDNYNTYYGPITVTQTETADDWKEVIVSEGGKIYSTMYSEANTPIGEETREGYFTLNDFKLEVAAGKTCTTYTNINDSIAGVYENTTTITGPYRETDNSITLGEGGKTVNSEGVTIVGPYSQTWNDDWSVCTTYYGAKYEYSTDGYYFSRIGTFTDYSDLDTGTHLYTTMSADAEETINANGFKVTVGGPATWYSSEGSEWYEVGAGGYASLNGSMVPMPEGGEVTILYNDNYEIADVTISGGIAMSEGWNYFDGYWYFVEGGTLVTNAWRLDSIGWCYLGDDGAMYTNTWIQDSVGWCYIGAEGYCLVGTHTIDGVEYTFDADGRWIEDTSSSTMSEGWNYIDGYWYFVEGGTLVTNAWRLDSIGWCYLGDDGAMYTNTWIQDSVGWCYIGAEGYCLVGTHTIGGVEYTFDADGRWIEDASSSTMSEGWNYIDGYWYFVEGGSYVTNQWRRDSIGWCYLGDDGAMLTNQWTTDSDGWCYIGPDGYCVTGTYYVDGAYHNFDSEGNWLGAA